MIDIKLTKPQREALYENLKNKRNYLLNDPDNLGSRKILEKWFAWNKLSHDKQLKILADWDKYYKEIKETPSYLIFQAQRKAASQGNWVRVKELAKDAAEIKKNKDYVLQKPTSIDPWDFNQDQDIKGYIEIEEKMKELTNYSSSTIDKELSDVFS